MALTCLHNPVYYTILSNNVHPNLIVKTPTTTQNPLQKTSIAEAWLFWYSWCRGTDREKQCVANDDELIGRHRPIADDEGD